MNHYLAIFYNHYGAIHFYQSLQKKGIQGELAPVPRRISASCGTCVRFQTNVPLPALYRGELVREIYQVNGSQLDLVFQGH